MGKKCDEKPQFKRVDYREKDVKEVGLSFVGHEISADENVINQLLHYDQLYTIRHGWNSPFFIGLLKGKIMGTRCPKCGDAWTPPRTHCWNLGCNLERTEWIEMPKKARVHTWTVAGWSGKSSLKRLPIVLVYAIFKGSNVAIANELRGINPWDVEFNMPVKAEFISKEKRKGVINDFYFIADEGWKPSPMNEEKKRVKKLVKPVYEWVKTLK